MKNRNGGKFNPSTDLELVVTFDGMWPTDPNALFRDRQQHLYLAHGRWGSSEPEIWHGDELIAFSDARETDFKRVTVKEALSWYAKCVPRSRGGSGDIGIVCGAAA